MKTSSSLYSSRRSLCIATASSLVFALSACGSTDDSTNAAEATAKSAIDAPGAYFDLSQWNITLPIDANADGKPDMVKVKDLQTYTHPDFFYLNEDKELVFTSPNVGVTTANSKNARSELRQMSRGINTRIKTKAPKNNFALAAHENAAAFAAIGGRMEATLEVNHVALNSARPEKYPSYSVVIGQIHAGNDPDRSKGFGYGNEPLKIFYKKFPDHDTGSVFWTYERNLPKADPNRTDIAYPVWGNTWENSADPGVDGIKLDESFSYVVNVYQNTMQLIFSAPGRETVNYTINLANNVDAYGKGDEKDFEQGYAGDWHYFKAGAYSQCNGGTSNPFWGTACGGTGVWETDKANGDYSQVTFSRLVLSEPKRF
ncbi:polysaccharide lyase family 7 protein [Glaciecola sp. MH2013]|uniref:polysaccharide lyase family 7 protein n=1 Tax=Glaciecola sp. MH2013 TaxID=2785524 RepID=UPI00189DF926|nr:polysaccharide lyase family 7 protein [Glaciecola sp. MH2013]MBF7073916.1 polysaccharide lyase family 7 protein [Glaciecola sp. MH2013]